jgi:hypothetical protein
MVASRRGAPSRGTLPSSGGSNAIIIQNAEGGRGESLTFFDFLKVGALLTRAERGGLLGFPERLIHNAISFKFLNEL